MTERPVFMLALRPEPHVDGIKALRAALKVLGRRFGLHCVSLQEYPPGHVEPVRPPAKNRHGDRRRYQPGSARNISRTGRSNPEIARQI
jgi:hypothetical protein